MLWVKAFHIVFMISWFAGLFYLPRLFVYHAMSEDDISKERFIIMERKLLNGIMLPAALLTIILGFWLLFDYAWQAYSSMYWLSVKLALVLVLLIYHGICYKFYLDFKQDKNTRSHVYYRFFNELPVLILIAIIILITVKPF